MMQRGDGRPDRRKRWLWGELLLFAAVVLASTAIFGLAATREPFSGDESRYIFNTRFFQWLFLEHNVTHREWGNDYWTHTQPMVARYVVGAGLWAQGYDLTQPLVRSYDWGLSRERNRATGRVPSDTLLHAARMPMVLLAGLSMGVLYLSGRLLRGPIAGLVAVGLALASPLGRPMLVRAWTEAPLMFFILLGLLVGLVGVRRGRGGGLHVGWALALGLVLGLALGTKLTAALSLVAVLGWGMVVGAAAAWRAAALGPLGWLGAAWRAGRGWVLAVAVALGVFVLTNPHLYPDPLEHSWHLVEQRRYEMNRQQRARPQVALHELGQRLAYVVGGSLVRFTWSGSAGLPLEALLAPIGFAGVVAASWRGLANTGKLPAESLLLLTVLVYFFGISGGLLLAWPKYILASLLLGTLLSGVGLVVLLDCLRQVFATPFRTVARPDATA